MTTVEEILKKAKSNKTNLDRYFNGGSHSLNKTLGELKRHELNALYLLSIEKPPELCKFLGVSMFDLEEMLNNPIYNSYTINKKRGGLRFISAPEVNLKTIQKRLNYFLQAYYLWIKPKEAHGFVVNPHYLGPRCNIVENAKAHVKKRFVLNIDLKDFFPNIPAFQVKQIFSSRYFHFNEQISTALTLLTTYQGALPIGAPTSPVISNFICLQLDTDLIEMCSKNGLSYSRYADDLTFSSETEINDHITSNLIQLITRNGFEINEKKIRMTTSSYRQKVTGLIVNEKVNVNRKILKQVRAMLHDLTMNGIETSVRRHFKTSQINERQIAKFTNRLRGYIDFIGQIRGNDDALYLRNKSAFDDIFKKHVATGIF